MQKFKRVLAFLLSLVMIVSSVNLTSVLTVNAAEDTSEESTVSDTETDTAEEASVSIYPVPQSITTNSTEGMKFSGTIDIVVHGEHDEATLPKLKEILEAEGYEFQDAGTVGTNAAIVLAVKCEDEDCNICKSVTDSANALDEEQGYVLESSDDNNTNGQVTIIGHDEDGVWYGVMSLLQIFKQKTSAGNFAEVTVSDYPDVKYRGYVEGFYGTPWTFEDRASLFEDTSLYKMTTYIYAPKDDKYHRSSWRTLYPDAEASNIKDLAEVAKENNMDFCWTIHPGGDYDYTTDSDSNGIVDDYEKLIAKIEQVYGLGVRQFGIFNDDIATSKANGVNHATVINDVWEYLTSKYDDVKPFITVATKYSKNTGANMETYFKPFMQTVNEDTIVLWTGNQTISPITKEIMEYPQTQTGVDRDLGVWWNYPVNDYYYGHLLMGSLDSLSNDVDNIAGFFLNPLSEANASKVAIYSGADYSWNIEAFDSEVSWKRSIQELVPEANEEFERFADNLSYNNYYNDKEKFFCDESKYLKDDLEAFENALNDGLEKEDASKLKVLFEQMVSDVPTLRKIENDALLEEITPWLNAYEALGKAGVAAMEALEYALDGDIGNAVEKANLLNGYLSESLSYKNYTIYGYKLVYVGSYRITPLLSTLYGQIMSIVNEKCANTLALTERMLSNVIALDIQDVSYSNKTYSISDISTTMNVDDYVGIAIPKVENIYKISAEVSSNEFKIQYSLNGIEWQDIESTYENGVLSTKDIVTGAYARLVCTADNTEATINNFSVLKAYEPKQPSISTNMRTYSTYYLEQALDGSLSTCFWSYSGTSDGTYIQVDLGEVARLNTVELYSGISKGAVDGYAQTQLEVSNDGLTWTKIATKALAEYQDVDSTMKKLEFDAGGAECRYFRFKEISASNRAAKVYEVKYDASHPYEDADRLALDTNMTIYKDYTPDKAMDNDITTYAWIYNRFADGSYYGSYKGQYIQVDLGTLVPLYDASIYFGKKSSSAVEGYYSVKLQTSVDGETWKDVGDSVSFEDYSNISGCFVASLEGDGSLTRYIRFVADEDYVNWAKVCEIKYNQTAKSIQTTGSASTNMARYVDTTTYTAYEISNVVDGSLSTKFYSSGTAKVGDYIQVDLGTVGTVFDASIYFGGNTSVSGSVDGFTEMDIQVSTDGSTWTTVTSTTSSEYSVVDDKYLASISLDGVSARYVRFTSTKAVAKRPQVYEIQFNNTVDTNVVRYADDLGTVKIGQSNYLDDLQLQTNPYIYEVSNNGTFIYPTNTITNVTKLSILQGAEVISNATVSVQDLYGNWKDVGILDKVWNEFEINQQILAVKLTFAGNTQPIINEILLIGPADYSRVNKAIASIPSDLSLYTKATVAVLNPAVDAVEEGLLIDEQTTVDRWAVAIEKAIMSLVKLADYTAVDAALAKVPADLSIYTKESVKAVEDAVAAVVREKDITEQSAVDAMAADIRDAVVCLELKDANYEAVEAALAKIPADLSIYTDETVKVVKAAERKAMLYNNKKITEQAAVDAMAQAIEDAVADLELKDADYTLVERARKSVPTDLSVYTDETVQAVNDALAAVVEGKKIIEQKTVDGWAEAIVAAVQGLQYKAAVYDAVNDAIAEVPEDLTIYTKESVDALNAAIAAVENDKDITAQDTINGWAQDILNAINALEEKEADYSKVETAIAKVPADMRIYTDETVKAVNDAVSAVVEGLKITKQSEVDDMAQAIEDAIAALELKDADYTAVEAAIAKVPEDLSIYTRGTVKAVTNAVAAVVEDLKITEQSEVDAMAKAIEDALAALELKSTLSGVIRVAGENRYETGFKVADTYKETLGVEKFQTALVATGKNFADALPGSYLAYVKQAPILLTNEKEESMNNVAAYITENVEAGADVYILGGTAVVPAEMDEKLTAAGYQPVRLAGENRYETNVKILEAAGVTGGEIIVATGKNFADSLSASAVRKPILLVKENLSDLQKEYLNTLKDSGFYIVGGEEAVGKDVEKELDAYGTVLDRLAGRNRRETSVLIAQKFFGNPTAAVTAYAGNFPDGLCGGPLAAELNVPLLLTVDGKTTEAADYMAAKNIELGYVLGGEKVLADETVETVFGLESTDEIILK